MKILVIGSGGREHALVWKLSQSPRVSALYCAPGNAGISQLAQCVPIQADDVAGLKSFAKEKHIDLTVVGPEAPLALGIADEFRRAQLRIFGPTRNAARIESSKAFAKELMIRQHIPTADARVFDSVEAALRHIEASSSPLVVKADGLAQGKGVTVAKSKEEAKQATVEMMEKQTFGQAGTRVLLEECIEGEELTLMAFADGKTVLPMIAAQDHKRVGDGDTGPNTGGMGAYAPPPILTPSLYKRIIETVLYPAIEGLSRVGSPFYGVLYGGLMIKHGEPFVLEYNARFGDPETQVILPLLKTDLVDILEAVVEHRLDQLHVEWSDQAAVCVVLTSGGYPGSYRTGIPITGLSMNQTPDHVAIFHAGTTWQDTRLVTAGGRVLGITGIGPELKVARDHAYQAAQAITFEGRHFRQDIASRVIDPCP